jgi:hypothetical protein
MEAVAECREVSNEEAAVQTTGTLEDRCGEQQPAAGYWNPLKWQTQDTVAQETPNGLTYGHAQNAATA